MEDGKHRPIDYLRISVTDRCNLKCVYCMPEGNIPCLEKEEVLSFEEIIKVCKSAAKLGIKKIKLTGGEPLVRPHFVSLVRQIKAVEGIEEITLTTNGILLEKQLEDLIEAGISQINISLDTLDPKRFKEITKVDGLDKVLAALHKVAHSDLKRVKVNALVAKHLNEEAICALAQLAQHEVIHVRFIELMPIGLGKQFERIGKEEMIAILEEKFGILKPYKGKLGNGPAQYWEIEGFKGKIGFISAVSECFCDACNRIRLTADGFLKLCLHSKAGLDVKHLLRSGMSEEELTRLIGEAIHYKPEKHHFGDAPREEDEDKIMAQIGG